MNIFAVDSDPVVAAVCLSDAHVVKMVLETAQILSTVHHLHNPSPPSYCYAKTHYHHPCVVWAGATLANYRWTVEHGMALAEEYTHRYGRTHMSEAVIRVLRVAPPLPDLPLQPFAQAMPDHFKSDNAVGSYRRYYREAKAHLHKWTKRNAPEWIWHCTAVRKRQRNVSIDL